MALVPQFKSYPQPTLSAREQWARQRQFLDGDGKMMSWEEKEHTKKTHLRSISALFNYRPH